LQSLFPSLSFMLKQFPLSCFFIPVLLLLYLYLLPPFLYIPLLFLLFVYLITVPPPYRSNGFSRSMYDRNRILFICRCFGSFVVVVVVEISSDVFCCYSGHWFFDMAAGFMGNLCRREHIHTFSPLTLTCKCTFM
jgi:hypothetical protein